jgi:hypothetical protein
MSAEKAIDAAAPGGHPVDALGNAVEIMRLP